MIVNYLFRNCQDARSTRKFSREHPEFANISVGAKHDRSKSLVSLFLNKKLARRFKGYDFDGNGYVEKTDFEQAVAKMCEAFGHGPDSAARQRLYDLTMQLWQRLVTTADANADGRISEAEYKNAFANSMLVTPENFEQGYRPFCEAVLDIVDVDGDGRQSLIALHMLLSFG
ncbi:EF-hand domain-containing protein [Microcoleus sp.]|uniref:EF-hand domain-containing protein n=1 Tax=Microcoleus sp. TaxID=44472 RepID=UPI003523A206